MLYNHSDIAQLVSAVLCSNGMPLTQTSNEEIIEAKLRLISDLCKHPMFKDVGMDEIKFLFFFYFSSFVSDGRKILLNSMLPCLRLNLNAGKQLVIITEIMETVLELFHQEKRNEDLKAVSSDCVAMIAKEMAEALVSCLLKQEERNVYILVCMIGIIVQLSRSKTSLHFRHMKRMTSLLRLSFC